MSKAQFNQIDLRTVCTFNKPIDVIWNVVRNTSSLNNIISSIKPDFASEPVLLNCQSTFEKDASFFFYINKQYKLLYKVKEIIETDYYCQITSKMYSSLNKDQTMTKSVYLHCIGPHKTMLVYERNCSLGDIPKEDEEKLKQKERNETIVFLDAIDHFITNNLHKKTQCEGRRFNTNSNTLIKMLNDFGRKSFMTSFGFHCNQLPIRSGSSIILVIKDKNKDKNKCYKVRFKIDYIHHNSRGLTAKINVYDVNDFCDGNIVKNWSNEETKASSYPCRYIIIDIVMINHEQTYYSMRHFFYDIVNEKKLGFVSKTKVTLLKKLSHVIEKH